MNSCVHIAEKSKLKLNVRVDQNQEGVQESKVIDHIHGEEIVLCVNDFEITITEIYNELYRLNFKTEEGRHMPSYTVKCPYCHTVKSVTQNSGTHCSNCGATLNIDNNGRIKSSKPGKK